MYAKRIKCKKCGKTLVTGVARNVEMITCTCGCTTFPNDTQAQKSVAKAERRHKKYEKH